MKLINIYDNLFVRLDKAKTTKYIKRIPKPTGKGYYYFYNQKQIKDYKEKGKVPEDGKEGGILSGIMSFFGFKDEKQATNKAKETFNANKKELSGVDIGTFTDYMNEYLSNKDKWDKKLAGKEKVVGKTKDGKKIVKKPSGQKKKSDSGKKWDMSLMRKVAGIVGSWEGEPEMITDPAKKQEILNSIAEGELILKTGKIHGRKMNKEELNNVLRTVNNAKKKIGLKPTLPAHLQAIADKQKGFTIEDVTPEGYGPEEPGDKSRGAGVTGKDIASPWEMTRDEWMKEKNSMKFDTGEYGSSKLGPSKTKTGAEKNADERSKIISNLNYNIKKENELRPLPGDKVRLSFKVDHADIVYKAIKEGKNIPKNVLKEYENYPEFEELIRNKPGDKNAVMSDEPKKIDKKDFPESISTIISNKDFTRAEGGDNRKNIERKIDKKEMKDGFEIFGERFIIARGQYGKWVVFEPKTGYSVGAGDTIKEAKESGIKTIQKAGEEKLKEALNRPKPELVTEVIEDVKPKQPDKKEPEKPKENEPAKGNQAKYDQAKQDIKETEELLKEYNEENTDNISYKNGEIKVGKYSFPQHQFNQIIEYGKKYESDDNSDEANNEWDDIKKHFKDKNSIGTALDLAENISEGTILPIDLMKKYADNKKIFEQSKEKLMGPKMFKAIKIGDKYYKLNKAKKKVPIGTISNGRKKVAEGKWVPVGEGKDKVSKPDKKKTDKKTEKPGASAGKEGAKERLKNTLKKIANILAEALSGKDVNQPTGQAVEEVGESSKRNKKIKVKKDKLDKFKENKKKNDSGKAKDDKPKKE